MKKFLMIALTMLLMLACAAGAEEAPEHVIIYFQDGSQVLLPAEIANDPQKLADYCSTYFPGRLYTMDGNAEALDFDAAISEAWTKAQYGEDSRAMLVRLVQLGLTETVVITSQGDEITVPSHYLKFADGVDAQHLLAYVYAPRTGEASVRETEGSNGEVILKAKSGKLAAILQYDGGNYTKILYDGVEGYIRTDCLVFHDGQKAPLGTGVLHVNGKKDGAKTVTVCADASSSAAKMDAWKTGTEVIVHEGDGKWYLVELDGWAGWVQAQYLTLIQE